MRFVDDEDGVASGLGFCEEEAIDFGDGFQAIHAADVQAELHGNRFDELVGIQDRVQDERGGKLRAELLEQRAAEGRLARADFAGDLDESFALPDAVKQMVECFAVLGTVKQEARVRRDVERRLFQAIILQVHGAVVARNLPNSPKSSHRFLTVAALKKSRTEPRP